MAFDSDDGFPDFPEKVSAQHGHLASLTAGLRRMHANGASWDVLAHAIDRLLRDVLRHFMAEEVVMEAARYPRLHEHRNEHDVFLRRLEVVRLECERKQTELMPLLVEMLDNWFKQHEATWDREASEAMRIE